MNKREENMLKADMDKAEWIRQEVQNLRTGETAEVYTDLDDAALETLVKIRLVVVLANTDLGFPLEEIHATLRVAHEAGIVEIQMDDDCTQYALVPTDPEEVLKTRPVWDPKKRMVRHPPSSLH